MENTTLAAAARSRLPEIQLVRALLIIAVVMIHATSFATLQMKDSSLYPVYHFLNVSMAFATPAFVFLSGFVLFYSYYTRPINGALISSFYRKRMTFVIIPYVFFSVIYFILCYNAYTPTMPAEETFRSFLIKLATGKAYTHLYYVFIMAQMYVLFPVLLLLFRRFSGLIKWAVPAALVVQLGFFIWNEEFLHITNLMSWAPSYATPYMLGAVLGTYYPRLRGWLHISREHAAPRRIAGWLTVLAAWLCCLTAMLVILSDCRMNGAVYSPLMLNVLKMLYSVTSSAMLLLIAPFLYRLLPGKGLRVLDSIAALSFGIYLLHPLLLYFLPEVPGRRRGFLALSCVVCRGLRPGARRHLADCCGGRSLYAGSVAVVWGAASQAGKRRCAGVGVALAEKQLSLPSSSTDCMFYSIFPDIGTTFVDMLYGMQDICHFELFSGHFGHLYCIMCNATHTLGLNEANILRIVQRSSYSIFFAPIRLTFSSFKLLRPQCPRAYHCLTEHALTNTSRAYTSQQCLLNYVHTPAR